MRTLNLLYAMEWLTVTTFIILFLIILRFPKHLSFNDVLNRRYGNTCIGMYRRLEKLHYKFIKIKLDLEFLDKCNIIPKSLYFKVHNPNIRNSKSYQLCQFKLLNLEINNKNCLLKQHVIEIDQAYFNFINTVSYLDFSCLYSR